MATPAAVACGHPITAEAACEVLQDGGNAFDAVIAAFFAACVAEPALASLGGGGYLLAQTSHGDALVYDFFVQTPLEPKSPDVIDFYPIHADFGTTQQEFHIGLGAVATPGAVRGAFAIHRELCSMPMTRLVEPAVRASRDGVTMSKLQSEIIEIIRPIFLATPEVRQVYAGGLNRDALPAEGERLLQEAMADTLGALAREGDNLFYEGEIARRIAALCREGGGHIGLEDLRRYRVQRRRPLAIEYRCSRLLTNPPPSSGGILIAFALELMKACDFGALDFGSAAHLGLLAHVMALTNKARVDLIASPDSRDSPDLLDESYLRRYRREVLSHAPSARGTTHVSIIDASNNVAAMTVSNGEGCGHHIPGTGVMLNNMLGEEDINPLGFHRWQPGKRMSSMMSPTLLRSEGRLVALGSGGSNRIRTAMLQVLSNLVDFGLPVRQAVERPRIHCERGHLSIEPGFAASDLAQLLASYPKHRLWDAPNLYFGGVHVAERVDGTFAAAGDPRRGGVTSFLR